MALTLEEAGLFRGLVDQIAGQQIPDTRLGRYYEGMQRLAHLGIAVPPELRMFETVVDWPALVVDSVAERIRQKSFIMPGADAPSGELREGWEANNLDSEQTMLWNDKLVFGRSFLCLGANEEDPAHPIITVESPREMAVSADLRMRRVRAALRVYGSTPQEPEPRYATLYTVDSTVWLERGPSGWSEVDRDNHRIGRVPVVPFFNRRRSGQWFGKSEMNRAISLSDAAARALTNLQVAAETHSVPQKWVLGMSKGDFVDKDGNQIPAWQAYFTAIWANANKEAKVGQFEASDLSNFTNTVEFYGRLIAGVYGLPIRYMGQNSANPPSAEGIRADESRTILRAELHMAADGDQLGRAMAFYERLRTGSWPEGNRIKTEFFDPATPTYAATVDGVQKLTGGKPILSIRGAWSELGWSPARQDQELRNMREEATDPTFQRFADILTSDAGTV